MRIITNESLTLDQILGKQKIRGSISQERMTKSREGEPPGNKIVIFASEKERTKFSL